MTPSCSIPDRVNAMAFAARFMAKPTIAIPGRQKTTRKINRSFRILDTLISALGDS